MPSRHGAPQRGEEPFYGKRPAGSAQIQGHVASLGQVDQVFLPRVGEAVTRRANLRMGGHLCQAHLISITLRIAHRPAGGFPIWVIALIFAHTAGEGPPGDLLGSAEIQALPGVHEDRIVAAGEAFPGPFGIAAVAPQVVGVGQAHLAAICGRRVEAVIFYPGVVRPVPPGMLLKSGDLK